MAAVTITFDVGGGARAIDSPAAAEIMAELGAYSKRRASHVLPICPVRRLVFRLLRWACGDEGKAAEWTRGWACPWKADLRPSGGPTLESYSDRAEAIKAELSWLRAHRGL